MHTAKVLKSLLTQKNLKLLSEQELSVIMEVLDNSSISYNLKKEQGWIRPSDLFEEVWGVDPKTMRGFLDAARVEASLPLRFSPIMKQSQVKQTEGWAQCPIEEKHLPTLIEPNSFAYEVAKGHFEAKLLEIIPQVLRGLS